MNTELIPIKRPLSTPNIVAMTFCVTSAVICSAITIAQIPRKVKHAYIVQYTTNYPYIPPTNVWVYGDSHKDAFYSTREQGTNVLGTWTFETWGN
jgi:hypothetical protein